VDSYCQKVKFSEQVVFCVNFVITIHTLNNIIWAGVVPNYTILALHNK